MTQSKILESDNKNRLIAMKKKPYHKNLLIISDIEGSSGCFSYEDSSFKTDGWARACVDMSLDVDAVIKALFAAGAENITVKDFHRTGYNLMPELIDRRAKIVHGYIKGPVPGLGATDGATALLMIGMHAPSGSKGFLAHTLTSRIKSITLNGSLLSEAELFSASLAPFNVSPVFFSGCPVACAHTKKAISWIDTFPIEKKSGKKKFDKIAWRKGLASAAAKSIAPKNSSIYLPRGEMKAVIKMKHGEKAAEKFAGRWGFRHMGDEIFIDSANINDLYTKLINLCYLNKFLLMFIKPSLLLFNLYGRSGLQWAKRRVFDKKNSI